MRRIAWIVALACIGFPALAEDDAPSTPIFSRSDSSFDEQSGKQLYAEICQDCHMANGKGAAGAGKYPNLSGNEKLEAAGYPLSLILQGRNGMPPVGKMMTDAQVAMIVNYVRTHFGNTYADAVKAEDVKPLR